MLVIGRNGATAEQQDDIEENTHDLRVFRDEHQRQAHERSVQAYKIESYWARFGLLSWYRKQNKGENY